MELTNDDQQRIVNAITLALHALFIAAGMNCTDLLESFTAVDMTCDRIHAFTVSTYPVNVRQGGDDLRKLSANLGLNVPLIAEMDIVDAFTASKGTNVH